jgi:ERCC4-related helicase|tara:strand:- start:277 stop:462 length:186 start_codon:yes stop_codon:yes gene_type:complete
MTQRFGRTGRKRSGKVITLATKEEKKKIAKAIASRKKIDSKPSPSSFSSSSSFPPLSSFSH